jgi:predicted RNA-binding protein
VALCILGEQAMCEAKVFLKKDDREQLIMEDVVRMQPDEGMYLLVNLLGEQKLVHGDIERIDFLKHAIYMKESPPPAAES